MISEIVKNTNLLNPHPDGCSDFLFTPIIWIDLIHNNYVSFDMSYFLIQKRYNSLTLYTQFSAYHSDYKIQIWKRSLLHWITVKWRAVWYTSTRDGFHQWPFCVRINIDVALRSMFAILSFLFAIAAAWANLSAAAVPLSDQSSICSYRSVSPVDQTPL